jgi:hypothetical protein
VNAFSNPGQPFVQLQQFEEAIGMVINEQQRFATNMENRLTSNSQKVLKSIESEMEQDSAGL